MPKVGKVPQSGIVVVSGIPGAGKTYIMVGEIIRQVLDHRRVVYTNLPLQWGKLRAYLYLKGVYGRGLPRDVARKLALYVRPLSHEHFNAFVGRLAWLDLRVGEIMASAGGGSFVDDPAFVERAARDRGLVELVAERGAEVVTGVGANWIPPLSCVIIDEAHKWFPNALQGKESTEVLAYTSMHRHLMHRVFILTQRSMNVSLSWRAMAVEFWGVTNWATTKLYGFVRFPFALFKVMKYHGADVRNGEIRPGAEPLDSDTYIPWLSGKVFFRLYDSHSHVMSLEAARRRVGQLVEGLQGKGDAMELPRSAVDRVGAFGLAVGRWFLKHWIIGLMVLMMGYTWLRPGKAVKVNEEDKAGVVVAGGVPGGGGGASAERAGPVGPRMQGVCSGGVVVDGQWIAVGSVGAGLRLVSVNPLAGSSVWDHNGRVFVWRVGGGVPVSSSSGGGRGGAGGESVAGSGGVGGGGSGSGLGAGAGFKRGVSGAAGKSGRVLPGAGGSGRAGRPQGG